jgi:hypothetical protein
MENDAVTYCKIKRWKRKAREGKHLTLLLGNKIIDVVEDEQELVDKALNTITENIKKE